MNALSILYVKSCFFPFSYHLSISFLGTKPSLKRHHEMRHEIMWCYSESESDNQGHCFKITLHWQIKYRNQVLNQVNYLIKSLSPKPRLVLYILNWATPMLQEKHFPSCFGSRTNSQLFLDNWVYGKEASFPFSTSPVCQRLLPTFQRKRSLKGLRCCETKSSNSQVIQKHESELWRWLVKQWKFLVGAVA